MDAPKEPFSARVQARAEAMMAEAEAEGLTAQVLHDGSLNVVGQSAALERWRKAEALAIAAETLREAGL